MNELLETRVLQPRLNREWRTIQAMIRCYCQGCHPGSAGLCPDCHALLDYAAARLERCRFGAEKPTCARCPVHCYQRKRREQIRAVMRYAGPRMLWRHPLLSFRHWLDRRYENPAAAALISRAPWAQEPNAPETEDTDSAF